MNNKQIIRLLQTYFLAANRKRFALFMVINLICLSLHYSFEIFYTRNRFSSLQAGINKIYGGIGINSNLVEIIFWFLPIFLFALYLQTVSVPENLIYILYRQHTKRKMIIAQFLFYLLLSSMYCLCYLGINFLIGVIAIHNIDVSYGRLLIIYLIQWSNFFTISLFFLMFVYGLKSYQLGGTLTSIILLSNGFIANEKVLKFLPGASTSTLRYGKEFLKSELVIFDIKSAFVWNTVYALLLLGLISIRYLTHSDEELWQLDK
ncbi:hypothetical protein [Enterococcus nangangensis]|uniref:hypothetical protein n=1 Tax=Enterococcus nangangensis TaxID=2559926 RepID=UPI0010F8D6C8|nr:hypothetical protein [Enterococcus nangangensis]